MHLSEYDYTDQQVKARQEIAQSARLKNISIREVSNGYVVEKNINYSLGADIQSGASVHKTPKDVAEYIEKYLSE